MVLLGLFVDFRVLMEKRSFFWRLETELSFTVQYWSILNGSKTTVAASTSTVKCFENDKC